MAVALAEVMVATDRRTEEGIRMGEEIEAIRKEGPYTQKQVAERLGLSLQGYLGYRRGYTLVTPNSLRKWAKALNVPVRDLARRLDVDVVGEPDATGLRQQLAALLPDASAEQLDRIAHRLTLLSPEDQRQILEGWDDHLLGRLTKLGLV